LDAKDRAVNGPDGPCGTVNSTCWFSLNDKSLCDIDVKLPDGNCVTMPADMLIEQRDGSFYVPLHQRDIDALPHHRAGQHREVDSRWPCVHEREEARSRV
jgi:hypothetical protein